MVVILHTYAKGMAFCVQSFSGAIPDESNINSWVLLFGMKPTCNKKCTHYSH